MTWRGVAPSRTPAHPRRSLINPQAETANYTKYAKCVGPRKSTESSGAHWATVFVRISAVMFSRLLVPLVLTSSLGSVRGVSSRE